VCVVCPCYVVCLGLRRLLLFTTTSILYYYYVYSLLLRLRRLLLFTTTLALLRLRRPLCSTRCTWLFFNVGESVWAELGVRL
jgi:hypothetical protein